MIISTLPIGLGPLMLSAIRVAGPRWLKAFVGRLKESRATAEMDILTSTSEEVCDVWNGHAMVRVAGRSRTKQVLCIRDESKNCEGLVNVSRYLYDGKCHWWHCFADLILTGRLSFGRTQRPS